MPCRAVDGSCIRLKPERKDHVWSYDFVHHRTDDGRAFRTLNILDEFSRECLAIRVKRKLNNLQPSKSLKLILAKKEPSTHDRAFDVAKAGDAHFYLSLRIDNSIGLSEQFFTIGSSRI